MTPEQLNELHELLMLFFREMATEDDKAISESIYIIEEHL